MTWPWAKPKQHPTDYFINFLLNQLTISHNLMLQAYEAIPKERAVLKSEALAMANVVKRRFPNLTVEETLSFIYEMDEAITKARADWAKEQVKIAATPITAGPPNAPTVPKK